MRCLGFVCVGIISLGACAKDPDYGTGTGGTAGGGGTGGWGAGGGGRYAPPALTLSHPNPIISRGAPVFSLPAGGAAVVTAPYHNGGSDAGSPTPAAPAWVAIKLTAGPTRILVSWDDGGTYNYKD